MNRFIWLIGWWCMLFGIAALAAGVILKNRRSSKEVYKGHTKARVVDLNLKPNKNPGSTFRNGYYPVIEYYAQGLLFRTEMDECSWPSKYEINDQIAICYDPADPDLWIIEEKSRKDHLPEILSAAGVVLIMISVVCMLRFTTAGNNV